MGRAKSVSLRRRRPNVGNAVQNARMDIKKRTLLCSTIHRWRLRPPPISKHFPNRSSLRRASFQRSTQFSATSRHRRFSCFGHRHHSRHKKERSVQSIKIHSLRNNQGSHFPRRRRVNVRCPKHTEIAIVMGPEIAVPVLGSDGEQNTRGSHICRHAIPNLDL